MTTYLLDTHVVIWWLEAPERISSLARMEIANPRNVVYFSAASMFEIAAKEVAGKLRFSADFRDCLTACRFENLSVTVSHADAIRDLPQHHRDPFDRLLVAQACVEGLTIVTKDQLIQLYDVPTLAA